MSMPDEAPLTWLDVARRLACIEPGGSPFPPAVFAARVGWYGLLLEADAPVDLNRVSEALETLFPSRVKTSPLRIELEGGQASAELTVDVEIGKGQFGA